MIPPKPAAFAAHLAPDSVEVKFVPFFEDRKRFDAPPRLLLVHTNAASGEGTVESAWNHSNAVPNENTLPHYQVDRDGRARKMCPSDRRGIANGTVGDKNENWKKLSPDQQNEIKAHGNVQHWSLAIETADTGTKNDPDISAFTPIQAEVVAQIIAFESIVHGFPISTPSTWHDAGVAAHTDPGDYPFWTLFRGKTCPGDKKKAQLRDAVMPRARAIRDAWTSGKTTEDAVPVTDDAAQASTVVRAGEGWMAIARRTIGEARWQEIRDLNGGPDRLLHPGDEITLPV